MQLMPAFGYVVVNRLDFGIVQKGMFPACHVYFYKVLIHDSSGAEVKVPHFRVPHLSLRQPDVFPAGHQVRNRIIFSQIVYIRCTDGMYCIRFVFFPFSPSVEDHQ